MRKSPQERFWSKVKKLPSGCWEWQARRDRKGYGEFKLDGKKVKAHRTSYEFSVGKIPDGKLMLHKCDNPPCVNPNHLYPGTVQDNSNDMVDRGRSLYGENSATSKLTEEDVLQIRLADELDYSRDEICAAWGISKSHLSNIINRLLWTHI